MIERLFVHVVKIYHQFPMTDRFGQHVAQDSSVGPDEVYPGRKGLGKPKEQHDERTVDVVADTVTVYTVGDANVNESDRIDVETQGGSVLLKDGDVIGVGRPEGMLGPNHTEIKVSLTRGSDAN